jgi:hypothetical protein
MTASVFRAGEVVRAVAVSGSPDPPVRLGGYRPYTERIRSAYRPPWIEEHAAVLCLVPVGRGVGRGQDAGRPVVAGLPAGGGGNIGQREGGRWLYPLLDSPLLRVRQGGLDPAEHTVRVVLASLFVPGMAVRLQLVEHLDDVSESGQKTQTIILYHGATS